MILIAFFSESVELSMTVHPSDDETSGMYLSSGWDGIMDGMDDSSQLAAAEHHKSVHRPSADREKHQSSSSWATRNTHSVRWKKLLPSREELETS